MLQCSLFFPGNVPSFSFISFSESVSISIESSQSFVIYLFNRRILYEQFSYTMEDQSTKKTGNNIYGDNLRCMLNNKCRPIDDEDNGPSCSH